MGALKSRVGPWDLPTGRRGSGGKTSQSLTCSVHAHFSRQHGLLPQLGTGVLLFTAAISVLLAGAALIDL